MGGDEFDYRDKNSIPWITIWCHFPLGNGTIDDEDDEDDDDDDDDVDDDNDASTWRVEMMMIISRAAMR